MFISQCACLALMGISAVGAATAQTHIIPRQQQTTPVPTGTATSPKVTAISACHLHGTELFCMAGSSEYQVKTTPPTATSELPAQFTGCHNHGSEMFCIGPKGDEVEVDAVNASSDEHNHEHDHGKEPTESSGGRNCHYHGNVEHCVGGDEEENLSCEVPKRDYNIGLRVGLLFAILATSAIGVFGPILLQKVLSPKSKIFFIILKQFGTGIIVSTAFVHLYTHASLMFENKCVGNLIYESTTSSIVMAGIFLSFCVEFVGQRIVLSRMRSASRLSSEHSLNALLSADVVSVLVMEAGILFHSLIIGLTLVLAADSFFLTLFVVILFHQVFEGIALGTRIAEIGTRTLSNTTTDIQPVRDADQETDKSIQSNNVDNASELSQVGYSMKKKLGLASLFAFITPIGMAIGIGVLQQFNGNDKATLIAIGTLDALSAGILVWVGVVEMWAADWMMGSHGHKAELAEADTFTTTVAGLGLVAGLALMSLLGKWA